MSKTLENSAVHAASGIQYTMRVRLVRRASFRYDMMTRNLLVRPFTARIRMGVPRLILGLQLRLGVGPRVIDGAKVADIDRVISIAIVAVVDRLIAFKKADEGNVAVLDWFISRAIDGTKLAVAVDDRLTNGKDSFERDIDELINVAGFAPSPCRRIRVSDVVLESSHALVLTDALLDQHRLVTNPKTINNAALPMLILKHEHRAIAWSEMRILS